MPRLHTFVLSDIHLADAEPPHPRNPLWKRFKRPKYFVDQVFKAAIEHIQSSSDGPIELVLNGDIFDFDSVMAIPENPPFSVSWIERKRGLNPEEPKSRFKLSIILNDHSVFFDALKAFIARGNRVVFVIGNHDVELHWPSVQADLKAHLGISPDDASNLVVAEWFYISNGDTLIEHGNQYDPYCLCFNPINPLIRKRQIAQMRLPFGNLAGKYMLNGMGLMNPHSDSSYIRGSFRDYMVFYYRYVMRTQPFLMWTWFWGAMLTLGVTIAEGLRPALSDPLTIGDRVESIAARANATPRMVWALRELHAHPAALNPIQTLRELWLDRAILLGLLFFVSFQFFSFLNVFVSVSLLWFVIPLLLMIPPFLFYARSVESDVKKTQEAALHAMPIAARISGVRRVINGHTHLPRHAWFGEIEYLNTGTWSPAFIDVECTQPYGKKCFAWIRPDGQGERIAGLYEWRDGQANEEPVSRPASTGAASEPVAETALRASG